MLKHFFIIVILASFLCFFYGILNIFLEVEENACRMTYMFQQPQFSKIEINNNKYPNYGLYYYYEGRLQKDANQILLNGAPVIFIPGNGGSFKQGRSLASVALRKGLDNSQGIHMDYFTIDYNEELSALFGGYLENQKIFLKTCVNKVLDLYKNSKNIKRTVVLIGHSMGGKVAQSVIGDPDIATLINTIIFISSPLDKPVITLDTEINKFYRTTDEILSKSRALYLPNCDLNICSKTELLQAVAEKLTFSNISESSPTENVLLISIGGGNRDLLVRAGLTTSKFCDLHAMTSSIPNVWVSCDHLSSVWCLQLILVINRFLFSISFKDLENNILFHKKKSIRMSSAVQYFAKIGNQAKVYEIEFLKENDYQNMWHEDSKRVFQKEFKNGLKRNYNHLISLAKYKNIQKLYIEINNYDDNNWLYGCIAKSISSKRNICEKGFAIGHHVEQIPFKENVRSIAILDLNNIRKTFVNWTHIVARIRPTNIPVNLSVDIYNSKDRNFNVKAPRWFSFFKKYLTNETVQGTIHYKLFIQDVDESYQALKVNIEPIVCRGNSYNIITKLCVPWASGFTRYKTLTEKTKESVVYVNSPISRPHGSNESSIVLEIFLDSACRYSISYQYSLPVTMARLIHEYYLWLPSHIIAILFIVLRKQISQPKVKNSAKLYLKAYTVFLQISSLYIVPTCRILRKLLTPFDFLPTSNINSTSLLVSFIIHSTSIVISLIVCLTIWFAIVMQGNFIFKIVSRTRHFINMSSSTLMSMLPVTFGIVTIAMSFSTCSGLGLILALLYYFILLSNAYTYRLQTLLWQKSKENFDENTLRCETKNKKGNNEQSFESGTEYINTIENEIQEENKNMNTLKGLQNFPFHITMFIILIVLTSLNIPSTIAWIKHYSTKSDHSLPDPSLIPSIIVLGCLSLLLQIKAPNQKFGNNVVSSLLYFCASACILYCQEAVYRLNFIIAVVFIIILAQELLCRLLKRVIVKSN